MPSSTDPFALTKPCVDCPFRSDVRPYLQKARVLEIEKALVRSSFHCHKTTDLSRDDEDEPEADSGYQATGKESHCAGALILLEKLERPSQMMRIAERLGLYNREKLKMDSPVYDSFTEMANAQPDALRSTSSRRK